MADLQDPSSAFFADSAKHEELLAKAVKETPGLHERLETMSRTLAASYGVSDANPRLSVARAPGLRIQDAPLGGAVRPVSAACAAAVGFGAAYAYAWACRQCVSGESVCAHAYAYAYAYAFAWVCQSERKCPTAPDGGAADAAAGDAGGEQDAAGPAEAGEGDPGKNPEAGGNADVGPPDAGGRPEAGDGDASVDSSIPLDAYVDAELVEAGLAWPKSGAP